MCECLLKYASESPRLSNSKIRVLQHILPSTCAFNIYRSLNLVPQAYRRSFQEIEQAIHPQLHVDVFLYMLRKEPQQLLRKLYPRSFIISSFDCEF